jgi:PhnB protein
MVARLNPYISFNGNARQALEFYQSVFGGRLSMNTFGQYGTEDSGISDLIMHGMLETDNGLTLMAADTPPGMKDVTVGNNIVVSLSGDDEHRLRGYWEKLAAAGTVSTPLQMQIWGDEYGSCTDQYGIDWMVDIGPQQGS